MYVYLVLSSTACGGPSDFRKVYDNLKDALAQRKRIFEYVNPVEDDDDFDVVIMRIDIVSGETCYIDNKGEIEGQSFYPS